MPDSTAPTAEVPPSDVKTADPDALEATALTTASATGAALTPETAKAEQRGPPIDKDAILHGKKLAIVTAALMSTMFLVALDQTILATALPALASDFNSFSKQGWVATAFVLTQTGTILFWGQILRIHKAKWVNLFGVFLFELGSLFCGVAPSIDFLIFGRALAGVGAAAIALILGMQFASLITVIAQITELHVRPKLFGVFGAVFGLSSVIGPLMGGAIVDNSTWRWCFYLNLPVGAVSALVTLLILKASPPMGYKGEDRTLRTLVHDTLHVDLIGTVLFFSATTCLVLGFQWGGNQYNWGNYRVVLCLVLSGVLYASWGLWNWRMGDKALVPTAVFKSWSIYAIALFAFCTRYIMLSVMYYLPLFYQAVRQDSATHSGISLLAFMLGVIITAIGGGQIVARIGYYWPLLVLGPIFQAIGVGLMYLISPTISNAQLIGFQMRVRCLCRTEAHGADNEDSLCGVGVGATLQNSGLAMQAEFKDTPHLVAQSSGLAFGAQFLGGSFGLSISQAIFATELGKNLATYAPDAPANLIANNPLAIYSLATDVIPGAILAYTTSLRFVLVLLVPLAGLSLFSAFFIKNIKISKPKAPPTPAKQAEATPNMSKAESHGDEKLEV